MLTDSHAREDAIDDMHRRFAEIVGSGAAVSADDVLPIIQCLTGKLGEPTRLDDPDVAGDSAVRALLRGDDSLGGDVPVWDCTPMYLDLIRTLITHHGVDRTRQVVGHEDLDRIQERNGVLRSLFRYEWFLTLDQLADRGEAFVNYLDQNRESLIATGYPTSTFTSWPAPLAVNLYPVRIPQNIPELTHGARGRDELIVPAPDLRWCRPSTKIRVELTRPKAPSSNQDRCPRGSTRCRYSDAPLMDPRDLNDLQRLEAGRSTLFELKIALFQRLAQALRRHSAIDLWEDCLSLLTDAMLGRDADFYLMVDHRRGTEIPEMGGLARRHLSEMLPGGLTELFELIGYVEKELTIGTVDSARRDLIALVDLDARDAYVASLGSLRQSELDAVLDAFRGRIAHEASFWPDFQARVNDALQNEFESEITVRQRVKRPLAVKFEPNMRLLVDWATLRFEQTGVFPSLPITELKGLTKNRFRREGKLWALAFDGKEVHVKDSTGLPYIAHLLRHPGREFPALQFVQAVKGMDPSAFTCGPEETEQLLDEIGASSLGLGDAGPMIDQQTKQELKYRLIEIDRHIKESIDFGDAYGGEALRAERDQIAQYLAGAVGVNGRDRVASSAAEKARINVTKAIKRSCDEITVVHPSLAAHLRAVTTGTYFSYKPLGDEPPAWEF